MSHMFIDGIKTGNWIRVVKERDYPKVETFVNCNFVICDCDGDLIEKGVVIQQVFDEDVVDLKIASYKADGFGTNDGQVLILITYIPWKWGDGFE